MEDAKCKAPHCWSEYGTACGECQSDRRESMVRIISERMENYTPSVRWDMGGRREKAEVIADALIKAALSDTTDLEYSELVGKCLDAFHAELSRWHRLEPDYEWTATAPMTAIVHAILEVVESNGKSIKAAPTPLEEAQEGLSLLVQRMAERKRP